MSPIRAGSRADDRGWGGVHLLDFVGRVFKTVAAFESGGDGACSCLGFRRNQAAQSGSDIFWRAVLRREPFACAEVFYADGVIQLIEGKGEDELRRPGGEGLGNGTDPAVMDDDA